MTQPTGQWPPHNGLPRATVSVGMDCADKSGFTLDELTRFVAAACELGGRGDQIVRVRVGWRNQIQRAWLDTRGDR